MVSNSCFKSYNGYTGGVRSASEADICYFSLPFVYCCSDLKGPHSNATANKQLYLQNIHTLQPFCFLKYIISHIISCHIISSYHIASVSIKNSRKNNLPGECDQLRTNRFVSGINKGQKLGQHCWCNG